MMDDNANFEKLYYMVLRDHIKMQEHLQEMVEHMRQIHIDCEEMYICEPDDE